MTACRTGLLCCTIAFTTALAGCSAAQPEVINSTWQITNVYTNPDTPSGLPDSVAGTATMVFGDSTVAGFTGCAPFQGRVSFTKDGAAAKPSEANHVDFHDMEIHEADCTGKERFFHDALADMLHGGFSMSRDGEDLILTTDGEDVDRPGIRLVD